MPGVPPIQQQDDLQSLVTDLFPGQYWMEIDGALVSDGSWSSAHGTYPIMVYPGIDPDANVVMIDFYTDFVWQDRPVELLIRLTFFDAKEGVETVPSESAVAHGFLVNEAIVFDQNPEGQIFIEELYPAFSGAFDFMLTSEDGEQIHVRGAASGIRNTGVPTFPEVDAPGEVAAELRNAIYSSGDDLETAFYFGEDSEGEPALYLDFLMEGVYSADPDTALPVLVRLLLPTEMDEHVALHPSSLGLPPVSELEHHEVGFQVQVADEEPFVALETDANEFFTGQVSEDGTISGSLRFYAHREDEYLVFEAAFVEIPVEES